MDIQVQNSGVVSGDAASKVKFILLEDGRLLYGKCQWHKDLAKDVCIDESMKVLGAGVFPDNIQEVSIEEDVWGGWKSTGYNVVTPLELRQSIRNALCSAVWEGEILLESLRDSTVLDTLCVKTIEEIQDDEGVWHVYRVLCTEGQVSSLGAFLQDGPWFIHFLNGERIAVVFKDAYFKFLHTDTETIEKVKEYSRTLGIPEDELNFFIEN